jgi:hypothetical protein
MIESHLGDNRYFYQSSKFRTGITVTGYLLVPTCEEFCPGFDFTEVSDGIYYADLEHENEEGFKEVDKYGLLIKEDGTPTKFEVIHIGNNGG